MHHKAYSAPDQSKSASRAVVEVPYYKYDGMLKDFD